MILFDQVIRGWEVGFPNMEVGEKAILICSPELGYGKAGMMPMIEPNARLWYEVEVMASLKLNHDQLRLVEDETNCLRKLAHTREALTDSTEKFRSHLLKMENAAAHSTAKVDQIFAAAGSSSAPTAAAAEE